METVLKRMRWRSQRVIRELGAAGIAGFVILLGCALLAVLVLVPTRRDAERVAAAARTSSKQQSVAGNRPSPPILAEQQLAHFYGALPPISQLHAITRSIIAAGQRQGVNVSEGEFKLVSDDSSPVLRYQMTLPLKAEYPQTREFIRDAMQVAPTLALEAVSFRRDNAAETALDTRLQLALYLLGPVASTP